MQIKKLFKYLPISLMTASLILAPSLTPPILLKNNDNNINQINNYHESADSEQIDPIKYIRNDVARQTGDLSVIESIKLVSTSGITNHSGAIVNKNDASSLLYMWGENSQGQLGLGNTGNENTLTPKPVAFNFPKAIKQVAIGFRHSAALLIDGSLYTWGGNENGQLGLGNSGSATNKNTPQLVNMPGKVSQILVGGDHSAALLDDGRVYIWGRNQYGQLGLGNTTPQSTPQQLTFFINKEITQIALGNDYSAALLTDGSFYTWGSNSHGQLGLGDAGSTTSRNTPQQVVFFKNDKIMQIAIAYNHSTVVLQDGSLYTWGSNAYGQLGWGATGPAITQPIPGLVNMLGKVSKIKLGAFHTVAILENGKLYAWGRNDTGQLGLDNLVVSFPTPQPLTFFNDKKITQLEVGAQHSLVMTDNDSFYTWGQNEYGQLGLNDTDFRNTPYFMPYLSNDSHIKANSDLTAEHAVNKMWVNNKFSLDGFKSAFNVTNIPYGGDQEITMSTKPSFDNKTKEVTINIGIKYFYDENGFLAPKKEVDKMVIGGFKYVSKTMIAGKTERFPIDIGTWEKTALNGNKLVRLIADNYLKLTEVPETAEFAISNLNLNYKTGVANFQLVSNQIYIEGDDNFQVIDSEPFSISLILTPRITEMNPITTGYPVDLTAAELKTKLFGTGTSVLNKVDLEAYMTVKVPVDNVNYYLIENSWISQAGDGTLKFSIYADKYYDSEGKEQTGSATTAASVVSFDLKLQPELSSIEVLTPPTNVRVDKFEAYINADGNSINSPKFKEFFKLTNAPSTATFTISDVASKPYDENFIRNQVNFKLTIDQFNIGEDNPSVYQQDYTLTLGQQHMPTTFEEKTSERIDMSMMQFIPLFATDGVNVDNLDVLKQYVDIKSYPSEATFSISAVDKKFDTGIVSFKLIASQGYDDKSDLKENLSSNTLTFELLPKKQDVVITAKSNITEADNADEFINQVQNLSGTAELETYLFPKYLTMSGDLPPNTVFHLESVEKDTDIVSGIVFLEIYPSQYYDENDNIKLGVPTGETLSVIFGAPRSHIKVKTGYPTDIRVDDFLKIIQANNVFDREVIEQYFVLTNVPSRATFTIKEPRIAPYINGVTSNITFELEISAFNKENGFSEVHTQKFTLALGTQHEPTSIQPKMLYDDSLRVDDVYNKLQTLTGNDLTNYLKNFLDMHSVPAGNTFTVLDLPQNIPTEGKLSFSVLPSQVYDSNSDISTENILPIELTLDLGKVYPPTTITQKTPTPVRVDTFVNNINSLKNKALYDYLVADFINAESVFDPTTMTAKIDSWNYLSGDVTATFTIMGYYGEDSNFVNQVKTYTFNYKLTPLYPSTSISVLGNYASDITPDQFKQRIIDDGTTINTNEYVLSSANITFLEKFINFASVPSNTTYTLTINEDLTDNATGVLNFNLSLDQHYADGDYKNEVLPVNNLVLNLAPQPADEEVVTYPPTVLTTNTNAPLIKSAQDFIDIVYPNGIVNLQMLRTYVNGLDTLPSSASITNLSIKDSSVVTFTLAVSAHYDSAGILAGATTYDFNLGLTPKYTPTTITTLPVGIYPKDLTPGAFKQQIIDDGAANSGDSYSLTVTNIKFLKQFLDLSTVPANATYTLVFNDVDDIVGQLDFSLMLNQFYNTDGELVNDGTNKTFHNLKLNLTPVDTPYAYPPTDLIPRADAPKVASADHFLEMIYDSNGDLKPTVLNQFIGGLESIPINTNIEIIFIAEKQGGAQYTIHISQFYDEDGVLQTQYQGNNGRTYAFDVEYISTEDTTISKNDENSLLWLWIVIGIAGPTIIGLLVWVFIRKSKKGSFSVKL